MFGIRKLTKAIKRLTKVLRLKRPGLVFLTIKNEVNDMLFFQLTLPAPGASDVIKRTLTTQIGSASPVSIDLAVADSVPEMSGADNDVVQGYLVDVDDAGNSSDPSSFSFVLTDTIPPPAPGQVGLTVTREV